MTINIKKHSNNISNFKEDYSMEIKFVKTQQTYSFDMMLPGGGFFGGEQTDVLPGGGFHANEEKLPGGGFFGGEQTDVLPGGGFHANEEKLPGGGFFGGEQTDVLPGGGFHANGEELPGGFFDRGQIEERPDDGDHRQHNKYSLYKGDRTNERIRLWN